MIHLLWILPALWVAGFLLTIFLMRKALAGMSRYDRCYITEQAVVIWPVFIYYIITEQL
jgi:hypothetical protein